MQEQGDDSAKGPGEQDKGRLLGTFQLGVPAAMEGSEITKITSVRKGMGKAKYSSLITTIPAEMCRALGIRPGDSMMWMLAKDATVMTVAKVGPSVATHASLIYTVLQNMLKKEGAKGEVKKMAEEVSKVLKAMGTVETLSDAEVERELRELMGKEKKGGKRQP
jgi:bifunctional DNA-binding transcriptional regulator/antitoxin component of YhaV-PrlF toxin-antitoxin module